MKGSIPILLVVVLGLLLASCATAEVWPGPGDSAERAYHQPPTQIDMLKMIEERAEKHACMQRSRMKQEIVRNSEIRTQLWYPTSNMFHYDVLFYRIDIKIDFDSAWIEGYVEITSSSLIDNLNFIDLTLHSQLEVAAVRCNGYAIPFSHSTEIMTANLPQYFNVGDIFTVKVEYMGHPAGPYGYESMSFDEYGGSPVCFTACEPFGSRNWWPCKDFPFDKPDSVEILVEHPASFGPRDMLCISNGTLQSRVVNGATATTHWFEKHPISTYLVSVSITDYDEVVQSWEYEPGEAMPVEHYYFPSVPPSLTTGSTYYMINYTIPSLNALSYYFGRYPFYDEKYGHTHWTHSGGAMEHQTSTSIGYSFDEEYVIAHELGHHWAGDNVTCASFHHVWLNEGFASYMEVLYFEYNYGWPTAWWWLDAQRQIDVGTPYLEALDETDPYYTQTIYDKGSWLVHMLRHQMGDSLFFPAMQNFFLQSEFAGGSATTEDLSDHLSQYYGSDMSWFFDAWVYQSGQPNYKCSYSCDPDTSEPGFLVTLVIEQQNTDGVFPMNVDLDANAGFYDSAFTVWNPNELDVYQFHFPYAVTSIVIDPDDHILKTVEQVPFTIHIAVGDVPDAYLDRPYGFAFWAVGGVPEYSWEFITGELPSGVTFDEDNGALSGTPAELGEFLFTIRCTDSDSPPNIEERTYSLSVSELIFDCGDCDGSGGVDIDDVVFLINHIFSGGPAPEPIYAGDTDCSGGVDIDDVVDLIVHIFSGGNVPCDTDGDGLPDC